MKRLNPTTGGGSDQYTGKGLFSLECMGGILILVFLLVTTGVNQRLSLRFLEQPPQKLKQLFFERQSVAKSNDQKNLFRILYIVTSSGTTLGTTGEFDRWSGMIVPVLKRNIGSYFEGDTTTTTIPRRSTNASSPLEYQVDLFVITSYTTTQEQKNLLRSSLPKSVGIQYWEEAMPYSYHCDSFEYESNDPIATNYKGCAMWNGTAKRIAALPKAEDIPGQIPPVRLRESSAQLARQHRYVIKDKLEYYDFFVSMEDDMMFSKSHVETHRKTSSKIQRLKKASTKSESNEASPAPWNEPLSKRRLDRMIAGFLRVEVLEADARNCKKKERKELIAHRNETELPIVLEPFAFNAIDTTNCCRLSPDLLQNFTSNVSPDANDVVIWESRLNALKIRPWTPIDRNSSSSLQNWFAVPGAMASPFPAYWTGYQISDGFETYYNKNRTTSYPGNAKKGGWMMAQQGGWLGSSSEILAWHTDLCKAVWDFLPPFSPDKMARDGLHRHNVEFYSGGIQLWSSKGCRIQRVYDMESATSFGNHFVYHTSNNKQCGFKYHPDVPNNIRPAIDALRKWRLQKRQNGPPAENIPKHVELYEAFDHKAHRLVQVQGLWNHLSAVRDGIIRDFLEDHEGGQQSR